MPTDRLPVVTIALIAINVFVYLFLQPKSGIDFSGNSLNQSALFHYGAIPYELTHPGQQCDLVDQGTAVACGKGRPTAAYRRSPRSSRRMFTHAGLLHLGGNMLFLWIFGNNVEDAMGRVRFIDLLPARRHRGAARCRSSLGPTRRRRRSAPRARSPAVLGGYIVLYPRARVLTLVFIFIFFTFIELPAYSSWSSGSRSRRSSARSASPIRPAAAAAWPTSPTSAASPSGCSRSSSSRSDEARPTAPKTPSTDARRDPRAGAGLRRRARSG